jgi:hypothetical protein
MKGRSGGPRPNSGGARPNTGGKRPGAGRKPTYKQPDPDAPRHVDETLDAEGYLALVVAGTVEPDPLRIAAARSLIRYQRRVQRAPLPAMSPQALERLEHPDIHPRADAEWERKASAALENARKEKK